MMGLAQSAGTERFHAPDEGLYVSEVDDESEVLQDLEDDSEVLQDPEVLQDLGDQIATLAAHLHAATYRLLTLIGEFDRRQGWEPEGHRSCAHWLAYRTGIDLGAAREKVRAARALTGLPQISASMERGELSFAKVRALTRVATPESEGDLLDLALCSTAAQLERTVRAWRRMSRFDEGELEKMRHRSRFFSVFPDEEGMYLVRGRLDPEVGAMLMRAIDAASDALFRVRTSGDTTSGGTTSDQEVEEIEPKQRRADAVGLLAERALAAGFGSAANAGTEKGSEQATEEPAEEPTEEATTEPQASADIVPLSGTRAERYQVVLHVDASTLKGEGKPGRSELEDGTRVSAETSRRLSCDASVVQLTKDGSPHDGSMLDASVLDGSVHDGPVHDGSVHDASVLNVGRKTRTIPPALRRALEARDRGCRFPGCGLRFTDAHHVRHWADGGETRLENLILLCRFHHRLVHEEGYTVHFPRGQRPYFLDPSMRLLPDVAPLPPPLPSQPVEALLRQNRLGAANSGRVTVEASPGIVEPVTRSAKPGPLTSTARYKREDDIPLSVIMRAVRALDESAPVSGSSRPS